MRNTKNNRQTKDINQIKISLSSPEDMLEKSWGEVVKPETINYRTYKPESGGLFCERVFGPTKDFECHCGKYKRIRYRGIVCDRCGVEVTEKKVRRERVGHISLVVPVAHIWYFKTLPNKIGYLLGLPSKKLDMIIYYERYVVINVGNEKILKIGVLLPLSGEFKNIGESFLKAIDLALYDIANQNINIYPKDSKGTALGAYKAARELEADGIEIVIGPIFYNSLERLAKINFVFE